MTKTVYEVSRNIYRKDDTRGPARNILILFHGKKRVTDHVGVMSCSFAFLPSAETAPID